MANINKLYSTIDNYEYNLLLLKLNPIINLMESLDKTQIAEFKEAFSFFDKNNDNIIEISQLPLLVRSLYQAPTEK